MTLRYQCRRCGEILVSQAAMERHADGPEKPGATFDLLGCLDEAAEAARLVR